MVFEIMMKKISVVVPSYNEEKSVNAMYERIDKIFKNQLSNYDYELIFIDDCSKDNTRTELEKICEKDKRVKAIFNANNFGYTRNVFFSLQQGSGDATFMLFGDLQDPPELLPKFVEKWEEGYKVILGQKTTSRENKIVFFLRTLYYKLMEKMSTTKQIQHFNGFGFYDKEFINIIKSIDDPLPYFKGIISELGMRQTILQYSQSESSRGKSNVNFSRAYDAALVGITAYTKGLLRMATFVGAGIGIISLIFAIFTFVNKILNWDSYPIGMASILIGVFFLGAMQLFFIGILGEYILSINTRMMKRPLVVVEKKINFEDK